MPATVPTSQEFIKQKQARLQLEVKRGRPRRFKDIGRQGHFYLMAEKATFLVQHNNPEKVLAIERFRFDHFEGKRTHRNVAPGDIEYRFGYWIVKKIGRGAGTWGWAQYAPLIPATDLRPLINLAIKQGTIRPQDSAAFRTEKRGDRASGQAHHQLVPEEREPSVDIRDSRQTTSGCPCASEDV